MYRELISHKSPIGEIEGIWVEGAQVARVAHL
jgi:hypothetical protein